MSDLIPPELAAGAQRMADGSIDLGMCRFDEALPLADIEGADYNPRKITDEAFDKLKTSIDRFGVIKPIIVNTNGTIVAGHQRTKAMDALGHTHTPAVLLGTEAGRNDEIRFNLIHNSVETSDSHLTCDVSGIEVGSYGIVDPDTVSGNREGRGAVLNSMGQLMTRFGAWGSIITDESGRVVHNAEYAWSCKIAQRPMLAYRLPNKLVGPLMETLSVDYGQYDFEQLDLKSYHQHKCQVSRMREHARRPLQSRLYEDTIIPDLQTGDRLVDFGAGYMDYVNRLRKQHWQAFAYEPHIRVPGKMAIDVARVVGDIEKLRREVKRNGLFDKVVNEAVLNSVINPMFEHYVLATVNALGHADATFYLTARSVPVEVDKMVGQGNRLLFTDDDGFSATYYDGVWSVQRYHTRETFSSLIERYFGEVTYSLTKNTNYQVAVCRQPLDLGAEQYAEALSEEFNMEYPGDFRHNRGDRLVEQIMERLAVRHGW